MTKATLGSTGVLLSQSLHPESFPSSTQGAQAWPSQSFVLLSHASRLHLPSAHPAPRLSAPWAGLQPSPARFQALSSGITGAVWPVSLWSEPLSRPPRKQPGSTPRQQLQGTGQRGAQMDTGKQEALLPGQPHPPRAREGGPHRCHWPAGRAGGRPCPPPMEKPDMLPVCRGCPTPSARPSVSQGLAKSFRRRLCNSRRGKQMREKKEWGREDKKN